MSERVEQLLDQLVSEQRETNRLLSELVQLQAMQIEVLAAEADPDAPSPTYLDGRPAL